MNWIDVWTDNYFNRSDAAEDIDNLMKKNYQGHKYVPWAIMQRHLYMMDENAEIEVMVNSNGGVVWTDKVEIKSNSTKEKEAKDGKISEYSFVNNYTYAHFVKVKCTFLGKTMIETYPVQDSSYKALNYYDSNIINKSIQRAKAKVISAVTGLGYMLYETGDLQFEEDDNKPTNEGKKIVKNDMKPEKKIVEVTSVDDGEFRELAKYVIDNKDTIGNVIRDINTSFVKKYSVALDPMKSVDDLTKDIMKVSNIEIFANMLISRHKKEIENAK